MMKITVITVCYNEKSRLIKTIESVRLQTYLNVEYLIIDGASTDGTIDILKEYSGSKNLSFFCEKDYGIYNAMNRGIARATGDYVFFLNSGDCFYDDKVLEKMAFYMENDADAIYYGDVCSMYADGSCIMSDYSAFDKAFMQNLLDGGMPCHQAIFAPRKALVNHYFKEQYAIRADYEWLVYSASRGVKCKYVPVVISCYDMSGISGTAKNRNQFQEETQDILKEYEDDFDKERALCPKDEIILKWKNAADKHFLMFQLMNQWLVLKQRGVNFASYFRLRGYGRIAIYGMGYMGQRLYDELKGSEISVEYGVDQKAQNLKLEVPVCRQNQALWNVDAVVVTAITCFNEIKEQISERAACKIISLEDVICEMLSVEKEG